MVGHAWPLRRSRRTDSDPVGRAREGGFCALNPETGTTSEGETHADALSNLAEATALYIEEFPLPLGERPFVTTFHITDVA